MSIPIVSKTYKNKQKEFLVGSIVRGKNSGTVYRIKTIINSYTEDTEYYLVVISPSTEPGFNINVGETHYSTKSDLELA